MKNKLYRAGMFLLVILWASLALTAWFSPAKQLSESERRPLAQFPEFTASTLFSGDFMEKFGNYSLDQFPLRDGFRQIKSVFHLYGLGQKDNNGIYLADGYAVKQEYPLNQSSLDHALNRFDRIYEKYLSGSDSAIHMAIVPEKGFYLAESAGQLGLDYGSLKRALTEGMPWAEHLDLTDALTAEDYYQTDIHWRQERLLNAAKKVCEALGIPAPRQEDYTVTALQRPFYGVYYGQAALPMEPEIMYILQSDLLEQCRVYDYETGTYGEIYDMTKLDSRDLYDVFLSGSRSLLTIENPKGPADKELILFRDSFGSSIAPLLVQGYSRVTLVDIRYIQIDVLDRFLEWNGQDVLFLYSSSILNNSETIK